MSVWPAHVGIVGVGFVGDAVLYSLQRKGVRCIAYDKFKEEYAGTFEQIAGCDVAFLCLPTLYGEELGEYDKSSILDVLARLKMARYSGLVVIKSTVEPGTSRALAEKFPELKIVHNPEFLTARTAREDFHNQYHIVIGPTPRREGEAKELGQFFKRHYPAAEVSVCESSTTSESMKIMVNSFYACKVQLCNEFYLMCKSLGIDYAEVMALMLRNGWISPTHTRVPGPDGQLSYGGACFPKDTKALLALMQRHGVPHRVLEGAVLEQHEMRDGEAGGADAKGPSVPTTLRPTPHQPSNSKTCPPYFAHPSAVVDVGARIGDGSKIWHFAHILSGAEIGQRCNIGQNVVVHSTVRMGDGVKIQNNVSVYDGVQLEDFVFLGPSMVFTNVRCPRSEIVRRDEYQATIVRRGASIGANATIVCGVEIGAYAFIGAGSVVTRDVPPHALVFGNPARIRGLVCRCGEIVERFSELPAGRSILAEQDGRVIECEACAGHNELSELAQEGGRSGGYALVVK